MANDKSLTESNNRQVGHKPHPWPQFNPDRCSCCLSAILHGLQNVVKVKKAPEVILSLEGKPIGLDKNAPAITATLHAQCWKTHYGHVAECEKCGGFSRVNKLADGSINRCGCTCHKGSPHCSFILDPNRVGSETIEKFNKGQL